MLANSTFQFTFANTPGATFTMLAATNASLCSRLIGLAVDPFTHGSLIQLQGRRNLGGGQVFLVVLAIATNDLWILK
jgi:hypothetical protein